MLRRKSKPGDKAAKKAKPKKEKKPKATKAKAKPRSKPKSPGVAVQKRPTDIYAAMLMISLAAVLIACLMLWLELSSYGSFPQWKT